jgi:hypothetical protein
MKTSIKCENINETLSFTPKHHCFYEFHYLLSIYINSGGIRLHCGCVICILKAGPCVGPNLVTGQRIMISILNHFEWEHTYI